MKRNLVSSLVIAGLFLSATPNIHASTGKLPFVSEILELQPDITQSELLSDVSTIAKNMGVTQSSVLEQIYTELKKDNEVGIKEHSKNSLKGGTGGTVSVGNSSKGDFFYTASQTAYLNHGHVGLYAASSTIVESVPGTGVRTISTTARKVDKGDALVKSVTTSSTNRTNAANWALDRVGVDAYSYNFATNRQTSHYGDKNCSKLIWSAYKLYGNLDLDNDGGLGVYPRDVRDAPNTKLIRNI